MKKIFIVLLSVLSLTAFAQQKKVAVLNPICRDNSVNFFYQQIVRAAMESAVTTTDEYVAFDRTAFDKVIEEHNFERSGAVEDSQIRQMGVYAGVDLVLITEVSAYEGYMSVLVKILNIETGESSRGLSELMEQTPPIVQSSCENLAKKLFGIVDIASGKRKGTLQLPEGRYEGEIKNGKPHGKGIMYFKEDNEYDRVSYDGEWENGVISGQGTMIWKGGKKYIGGWFNNLKSGNGTFYAPGDNGTTKYEGNYVNGDLVGNITLYMSNGEKYVGPMPKSDGTVTGTHYYPNGRKFIGEFDGNFRKQGKGTMYFQEGKAVGYWKNDVLQGFVQVYGNDGSEEYGHFVNGQADGEWTRHTSSGKYYKGRYSNGVMTVQYH